MTTTSLVDVPPWWPEAGESIHGWTAVILDANDVRASLVHPDRPGFCIRPWQGAFLSPSLAILDRRDPATLRVLPDRGLWKDRDDVAGILHRLEIAIDRWRTR